MTYISQTGATILCYFTGKVRIIPEPVSDAVDVNLARGIKILHLNKSTS